MKETCRDEHGGGLIVSEPDTDVVLLFLVNEFDKVQLIVMLEVILKSLEKLNKPDLSLYKCS